MYLNIEFLNEIKFLVSKCIKTRFCHTRKLLLFIDDESVIYYLEIEVLSHDRSCDPELNDTFYLTQINDFVQQILGEWRYQGQLKFLLNAGTIARDVSITMLRCNKDIDGVYLPGEKESIKQINKEHMWKNKILFILKYNPSGIALNEITNRTRGIKNPITRKQYLQDLVLENKIEMFQSGRYLKRPKTFYRIKQNENSTPNDSGTADTEAAGAEIEAGALV
jgi:hypothetical protein